MERNEEKIKEFRTSPRGIQQVRNIGKKRWKKKCATEGCSKSDIGKTDFCSACGGGKRCKTEGCKKGAIGKTDFCKAHGGGKRCATEGCSKSAQGKTDFCIACGGGRRCSRLDAHTLDDFAPTAYTKVNDIHYCLGCFSSLCPELVKRWQIRREHYVLAEIQRRIPELEPFFITWDCAIGGGCSLKKPDMLWDFQTWYLHIEIDEDNKRHEQCPRRLIEINKDMGGRPGIVVRVNPDPLLRHSRLPDGTMRWSKYEKTFDAGMDNVEAMIRKLCNGDVFDYSPNLHATSPAPSVYRI